MKDGKKFVMWQEKFSTGIEAIDRQHKFWINLVNKFHKGLDLKWPPNIVIETLLELQEYSRIHFTAEYDLFHATDYPYKEMHVKEHQKFAEKVDELIHAYEQKGDGVKEGMSDFLIKWLVNHLEDTDQGYVKYIKK